MSHSVAKTVGTRLRTIHSNDQDLLSSLNLYSGYLIARGYKEDSVLYHLAATANRSRSSLICGQSRKNNSFVLPLVTNLHPATTVLSKIARNALEEACEADPVISYIIPKSSLVVAYKKLPNLQVLLCKNDQNSRLDRPTSPSKFGYLQTNCSCLVCKASVFSKYITPPSLPNYSVKIPELTTCKSGPYIVYHLVCNSSKPECRNAHYVGRASSVPGASAMGHRWSVHKSHHKKAFLGCEMTKHLYNFHRGENPQQFVTIQIIQTASSVEEVQKLELIWQRKLFSFKPTGLNVREENLDI